MPRVNVGEAKTHLCRLLRRVEAGEEILITRRDIPLARLVPYARPRAPRTLGLFDGQPFSMAVDFDELPGDIAAAFGADGR
ncbi:MAG: type II toxin-antitoxin system prevent-host-death family antitoxin [Myxococcales bacterium]|nr:type II toxin-antitoxin system prevent-host-death family antitoxin [Myxococcales bacterium]